MISGFLVVDKPAGITSHDVVSVLRAMLGIKKIGHTGTLDPFATGVLPMAIGPSTRLIQFLDESRKVYDARVQLGRRTDTGDLTGTVQDERPVPDLELGAVSASLQEFVGDRMQTPPAYSAVKVDGKALYKYAREGQAVTAKARPIRIHSMDALNVGQDWVDVRVVCSRGTYVRVLAEEIGEMLGTVGHLSALRRTASGPFSLDGSVGFPELATVAADRTDWKPSASSGSWSGAGAVADSRRGSRAPAAGVCISGVGVVSLAPLCAVRSGPQAASPAGTHGWRPRWDRRRRSLVGLRGRTDVGCDGEHGIGAPSGPHVGHRLNGFY